MNPEVQAIVDENRRRNAEVNAPFNPVTGEGSILSRDHVVIEDFPIKEQWLPYTMLEVPLVKQIVKAGSIEKFFSRTLKKHRAPDEDEYNYIVEQFLRIRYQYDFAFWAFLNASIKAKGGGGDMHFRLNRAQRKLITKLEQMRNAGQPIRLILLKARQWGGSTAIQIYIAWLQLIHKYGLNSLIVGHVKAVAYEVKDMFDKLIKSYPTQLLHELGTDYDPNEPKITGVGQSGDIHRIPARNCKIKVGSYENPDSARGGDYNLVHCTEVGLWAPTLMKSPENVVRSACSGITMRPYTMIVYESTANGTGNFFEREYNSAKKGTSQFKSLFIPWYDIEWDSIPLKNPEILAKKLWENRENQYTANNREEPGAYLWYLWKCGATLEGIAWYIQERTKYTDHGDMASECPTDDNEAFVYSGHKVFNDLQVRKLMDTCRPPKFIGDVYGNADNGAKALENVKFVEDKIGLLCVWYKPEIDPMHRVKNRYLVVVDIGGRGSKADWSVICVIDRYFLMDGDRPEVVAQWRGHIDMDRLAWKAAQIAKWYDDALLVIESNTLETKDKDRMVDGEASEFILSQIKNVYDNLYARKQKEEDIIKQAPKKYGFHTNVHTKPTIIHHLVEMVREQGYVERDEQALDEMLTYEQKPNGAYGAIAGKHDDLLMTRAIGLWIAYNPEEMPLPYIIDKTPRPNKRLRPKEITEAVIC